MNKNYVNINYSTDGEEELVSSLKGITNGESSIIETKLSREINTYYYILENGLLDIAGYSAKENDYKFSSYNVANYQIWFFQEKNKSTVESILWISKMRMKQ